MTSFGWKRKAGQKVSKEASSQFENQANEAEESGNHGDNFWDAFSKRRKVLILEDAASKSLRLKAEGETLAEAGRYWEAITKWDEALQLTPANEFLLELKAQAFMELHEDFPAVEAAQQAAKCAPRWWIAHQTLGRAELGLGEITMAIKSFSRAIHLNPAEQELWQEDLHWACSLREQLRARTEAPPSHDGEEASLRSLSNSGQTGVCKKCKRVLEHRGRDDDKPLDSPAEERNAPCGRGGQQALSPPAENLKDGTSSTGAVCSERVLEREGVGGDQPLDLPAEERNAPCGRSGQQALSPPAENLTDGTCSTGAACSERLLEGGSGGDGDAQQNLPTKRRNDRGDRSDRIPSTSAENPRDGPDSTNALFCREGYR